MSNARALLNMVVCAVVLAAGARAQSVISARSGVIHYVEGDVTIDGNAIHQKFAEFPDVKPGQVVATEQGRVEILLTPGVFLRLAENSSVRMLSNVLADTRLQVVSGSALVEVGELLEGNAISFDAADAHISLGKKGLYRIDADPASLRVFDGQARVASGTENLTAKKGHRIDLAGTTLADTKFEVKDTDPFYRWSSRRAEYVAAANVISARVTSNSDYRSGFGSSRGAWSWNPYFGMYTFLPGNGVYWSPFGSPFYSPAVIGVLYMPQRRAAMMSPGFGSPMGMGGLGVGRGVGGGVGGRMMGGGGGMHGGGGMAGGTMPPGGGGGMRGGGASRGR